MCFSSEFLDGYMKMSTILCMIFGLSVLILSIVVTNNIQQEVQLRLDPHASQNAFLMVLLVLGIILFFSGLQGYCGIKDKKKSWKIMYQRTMIVLFVAFLTISITSFILIKQIRDSIQNEQTCSTNSWVKQLNDIFLQGTGVFCKDSCPCNMQNLIEFNEYCHPCLIQNENRQFINVDQNNFNMTKDVTFPVKYQSCPNVNISQIQKKVDFIEQIEREYECTGICTAYPFYMFSNINSGLPKNKKNCGVYISEHIFKDGVCYAIITFVIALMLLGNLTVFVLRKYQRILDNRKEDNFQFEFELEKFYEKQQNIQLTSENPEKQQQSEQCRMSNLEEIN